jgi:hypothetical protein
LRVSVCVPLREDQKDQWDKGKPIPEPVQKVLPPKQTLVAGTIFERVHALFRVGPWGPDGRCRRTQIPPLNLAIQSGEGRRHKILPVGENLGKLLVGQLLIVLIESDFAHRAFS